MGGGQGTVSIVTGVGWLWWLEDPTLVYLQLSQGNRQ